MTFSFRILLALLCVCLTGIDGSADVVDGVALPRRAAIVVSKQIQPYLQAVEGMQARFETAGVEIDAIYHFDEYRGKSEPVLKEKLSQGNVGLLAGVGPEACGFIWTRFPGDTLKKIYCMVMNPDTILPQDQVACGVPLNIPVRDQVAGVAAALPAVKQVGLLYDPANNAAFANEAAMLGAQTGLDLTLLVVRDRTRIQRVLSRSWPRIQGLWLIPDSTVISESLVRYIIKEALLNNVAVYGYNRFFLDTGAAMSFILDYARIGRQTADLGVELLAGGACLSMAPYYEIRYNRNVLSRLGLEADHRPPDSRSGDKSP